MQDDVQQAAAEVCLVDEGAVLAGEQHGQRLVLQLQACGVWVWV
jgi:hypothetical protein